MGPDDMRTVLPSDPGPALPSGAIGIGLDRLAGNISELDNLLTQVFARLDPSLLPSDPKEQDDRLRSLQHAVSSLYRRIDL